MAGAPFVVVIVQYGTGKSAEKLHIKISSKPRTIGELETLSRTINILHLFTSERCHAMINPLAHGLTNLRRTDFAKTTLHTNLRTIFDELAA